MHKHLIQTIDEQFGDKCRWQSWNGDIYLTDKKILFRLPNTEPSFLFERTEDKRIPIAHLERVWNNKIRHAFSLDIRLAVGSFVAETCETCKGAKRLYLCPECYGLGEDEFAIEVEAEVQPCQKCKGRGHGADLSATTSECYHCDGYGKKQTPLTVKQESGGNEPGNSALTANFDLRLLEIILSVCPTAQLHSLMPNKPIYFSGGQIDGLIMPMVVPNHG